MDVTRMSAAELLAEKARREQRRAAGLPLIIHAADTPRAPAPVPAPAVTPAPHDRMNGTERAYSQVLEARKRAGEIRDWAFEPMKLRLAGRTYYTPDFRVITAAGVVELHEVKGHWRDDARVKIKVAAELHPFRFLAVQKRRAKLGGGWITEHIPGPHA